MIFCVSCGVDVGVFDQALQDLHKFRSGGLQLLQVMKGKFLEELFALMGQFDQYLAPIIGCPQAAKKAAIDETVDQLHRAVVL